jgi:hypothetical protein
VEQPPELDVPERPTRPPRPRRRRRRIRLRWLAGLLLLVVVFLIGLVVGRAIQDAPKPGGSQTGVRTLKSSTLEPVRTVVVTVTQP